MLLTVIMAEMSNKKLKALVRYYCLTFWYGGEERPKKRDVDQTEAKKVRE